MLASLIIIVLLLSMGSSMQRCYMQYTVMIHHQPPSRYIAHAPAVPNCRGEGRTRNEALRQLKTAIEEWLLETEITTLEINTPISTSMPQESMPQENPWLATAGGFADDPMLEPMLQKILAEREAERPKDEECRSIS